MTIGVEAPSPTGPAGSEDTARRSSVAAGLKALVIGPALATATLSRELLPKRLALPVFGSDALSSVAYATQEMLIVLGLGGAALLGMAPWVAAAIAALLILVVWSYRQICLAYPNGGGAYVVSAENFGPRVALVAGTALLIDYVLTVAVSVTAGVDAVVSYDPSLAAHEASLSVGAIGLLALANLRGVRESGRTFAVPTYGFVLIVLAMLGVAGIRLALGQHPAAVSAGYHVTEPHAASGVILALLVLRGFASGCTALTGVEAISNGVPAFRLPKSKNAANTLAIMGILSVTMFAGITALALVTKVHLAADGDTLQGAPAGYVQPTALAQVGAAVFGAGPLYLALQAFTAAILVLAANTAFNGFPTLASLLARDHFLPRQLHTRGDRLVFSNGIIVLAAASAALVWAFSANADKLIQLYIVGVFVAFTLAQAGMVRHWRRPLGARADQSPPIHRRVRRAMLVNATGAVATGLVLVVVLATKFTHGAWIVVIAMPLVYWLMSRIHRHYEDVEQALSVSSLATALDPRPAHHRVVVLAPRLDRSTLHAVAYARELHATSREAVTLAADPAASDELARAWPSLDASMPLVMLDTPFRDITGPLLDHIRGVRGTHPRDLVTVVVPEIVAGGYWEQKLHNQSAAALLGHLNRIPGVVVSHVPHQLPPKQ